MLLATFNTTDSNFAEYSSNDIGFTGDLALSGSITGGNFNLQAVNSNAANYTVVISARYF
jgi:hypothetical protein